MKPYILLTALSLSVLTLKSQNLQEQQFAFNNVQTNINNNENNTHNRGRSSTALSSLGNNGNFNEPKNNIKQAKQKSTKHKIQVQTNTISVNNNPVYRGNVFDVNDNVNTVNIVNTNSNPVVEDKKVVVNKPLIKQYDGLDFKPSGLSGRDYSNGGKLKKGEKNIYKPSATKHKTIHKRKPSFKKTKYRTSKCAKW